LHAFWTEGARVYTLVLVKRVIHFSSLKYTSVRDNFNLNHIMNKITLKNVLRNFTGFTNYTLAMTTQLPHFSFHRSLTDKVTCCLILSTVLGCTTPSAETMEFWICLISDSTWQIDSQLTSSHTVMQRKLTSSFKDSGHVQSSL